MRLILDYLIDEDVERIKGGDRHSSFILTQADIEEIILDLGAAFRRCENGSGGRQILGRAFYVVEDGVPQSVRHEAIYSPRALAALTKTSVDTPQPQQ